MLWSSPSFQLAKDTDSRTANPHGSFLLPLGVGLDYAVTERLALTADFLPTFTSLGETVRANGQNFDLHTNVMSDHLTSYSEKRSMRQPRSRKRCTIFLRPAVASRR